MCTGLHEIDVVTIGPAMLAMYKDTESTTQYIDMLEEVRKLDTKVAAIAGRSVLASGDFPHECEKWNALG